MQAKLYIIQREECSSASCVTKATTAAKHRSSTKRPRHAPAEQKSSDEGNAAAKPCCSSKRLRGQPAQQKNSDEGNAVVIPSSCMTANRGAPRAVGASSSLQCVAEYDASLPQVELHLHENAAGRPQALRQGTNRSTSAPGIDYIASKTVKTVSKCVARQHWDAARQAGSLAHDAQQVEMQPRGMGQSCSTALRCPTNKKNTPAPGCDGVGQEADKVLKTSCKRTAVNQPLERVSAPCGCPQTRVAPQIIVQKRPTAQQSSSNVNYPPLPRTTERGRPVERNSLLN